MNPFIIATTVVSFLVLAAQPPPDWLETWTRASQLAAEGKNAEVLARIQALQASSAGNRR